MSDSHPTLQLPPDLPQPAGRRRLLLLAAAGLAAFIVICVAALALALLFSPGLRARLPLVGGPPPEGPDRFAAPSAGPVRISDDFATPNERWDRSTTQIVDGAYELTLELDNFDSYGLFLGANPVRDFDMAVDVAQVAGDPRAEYGIRFRQTAPDDHLIFSISGSGYYRLARVKDTTYTSLVPWTRDSRIATGAGAVNRLRVVAEGPSITGYINGEQVLTYTDEEQAAGQLTLGLVTFERGDLTVRFDNIAGFALQPAPLNDVQPTRVTLDETFDSPAEAPWSVGGATVVDGAYELFVGGPVQSWQQPLPTGSSQVEGDFVLEVEATMLSGNPGSIYGIMFGDDGRFSFFTVYLLPEGGIAILRNRPDQDELVLPATPLEAVNPGLNVTNRIRAEVSGRTLTLTINGEQLPPLEFVEGISFDGRVGVVLRSADADGVRVRFDNFSLEELD